MALSLRASGDHLTQGKRLAFVLITMILLPLLALAFIGAKLIDGQSQMAHLEVQRTWEQRLRSSEQAVQVIIRGFERELNRYANELPHTENPAQLRETGKLFPRALMFLVFTPQGKLLYPPESDAQSHTESALINRTRVLWPLISRDLTSKTTGSAWIPFESQGSMSFLWWRQQRGRIVAFEVPGSELMSELMAQLPDTPFDHQSNARSELIVLMDAIGQTVYQWGTRRSDLVDKPLTSLEISAPLTGWSLAYYSAPSPLPDEITYTLRTALAFGLLSVGCALSAGAWLIWRARMREAKVAQQRVTFVNQVSHELKTPLTNIRMYAELLRESFEGDDERELSRSEQRYLEVIHEESGRLSRLVTNVLTFASGQEGRLNLQPVACIPDTLTQSVLATLTPNLKASGIELELNLATPQMRQLDPDLYRQILINLLSNVEKYAKSGQWAQVSTYEDGDYFVLRVADRGLGIAHANREKIFEPFWRGSDKLTEGISGTGIGLDIARRLARLHGGDLKLVSSSHGQGAVFEARFHSPLTTRTADESSNC